MPAPRRAAVEPPGPASSSDFLERRLPGVEVEIAYPTYRFGDVLCTHGHYLDPHARLSGSRGDRLLTRTLWAIAAGGPEEPTCVEDYESVTTLLTEWLYIAAQMPHGTHAQQNVFRAAQRAGRLRLGPGARRSAAPSGWRRSCATAARLRAATAALPSEAHFDAVVRDEAARQAREQPLAGPPCVAPALPRADRDLAQRPLRARARGLRPGRRQPRLGPARPSRSSSPTPTSRSPTSAAAGDGATRYWNTGSWIYEPDLSSRQAYARYLRYAWPGTAIVIDDDEPAAAPARAPRRPQPAERRPGPARRLMRRFAPASLARRLGGLIPIIGLGRSPQSSGMSAKHARQPRRRGPDARRPT